MQNINWDDFEPVEQSDIEPADGIDWEQYEPVNATEENQPPLDPRNEFLINRGREHLEEGFDILNLGKGLLSGVSGTTTRLVPGLKPEGAVGKVGEFVGSMLPIGKAIKGAQYGLTSLVSKSPIFKNQLQSLANILGVGVGGAAYSGLEEATESGKFKMPSAESLLEHGATWATIDAFLKGVGWTGRFGKALLDKAKSAGNTPTEILEKTLQKVGTGENVGEKVLAELEGKSLEQITKEVNAADRASKDILGKEVEKRANDLRTKKVEKKDFSKLEGNITEKSKPYLPAEFEAEKIAEEAISEDLTNRIDSVAERAGSERELGMNIKNDLETEIGFSKQYTDELYEIAKNTATKSEANFQNTANAIVEQVKKLQSGNLKTTPAGYKEVEKKLLNALEDLGYKPIIDANGKFEGAAQDISPDISVGIELKKRLNKIINYDLIETGAQDFLKTPAAMLRNDIRSSYGPKDSPARKAFEKAEKEFGEIAEKKGKKSITNMRLTEKPESIAKAIKTPSGLADVKEVVSKQQFAQIERELLEYMKGLNEERAAKFYREMRPSLNADTRNIAEEIIASKAPPESPTRRIAQRNKIQDMVIDDISRASVTGQRPEKVLDLWKTKEGQQLIKHALENNPNRKEVLKYLTDQSFNDFYSSVVNAEGQINFKKMNELLRDSATAENIRMVAGEEGLDFLKQLEKLTERFNRNKSFIENRLDKGSRKDRKDISNELDKLGRERFKKGKEKRARLSEEERLAEEAKEKSHLIYKLDDWLSSYGWKAKGLLTAIGAVKTGIFPAAAVAIGWDVFSALAKNKNVRDALKKAAISSENPVHILKSIDALLKAEDES